MTDQNKASAPENDEVPADTGGNAAAEGGGLLADALPSAGTPRDDLKVKLSSQLVGLLSSQLYQTSVKALEELVVNGYDAEAMECRVALQREADGRELITVFDDGIGMDEAGLADLWHVGHSTKRQAAIELARKRKQIGRFGIGKLATRAVATRVSYITRTQKDGLLATTVDYDKFEDDPEGGEEVLLPVRQVTLDLLREDAALVENLRRSGVDLKTLEGDDAHWTLVVLEGMTDRASDLRTRTVTWVLSTAMPLRDEFKLFLDGKQVESSKSAFKAIASFEVADLPKKRLENLGKSTEMEWRIEDGKLVSEAFPDGITGSVLVTERSLYEGKSQDLRRSHGFFVRVRGRLVALGDPLFGIEPLQFEVFNRFRADIEADDLDDDVVAPREGIGLTGRREQFVTVLGELFYEARARYEAWEKKQADKDKRAKEDVRQFVQPRLVERPIADTLIAEVGDLAREGSEALGNGPDADNSWFYLDLDDDTDLAALVKRLYSPGRDSTYAYERTQMGRTARMVQFDPSKSVFFVNTDHELVRAHDDDPRARPLLEDLLTAEALLEVYLRSVGVPASAVGEVLERRDLLLRSLTKDRVFSLAAIAADLRESSDDEHDLEVNLVIACRALGFVAKHIGGDSEPDGVARLTGYPSGEQKIILEAKSSQKVPSLGAIDFAGLHSHMTNHSASGCLLVAPDYPGGSRGDNAEAAKRAEILRISCWTIEQLSAVVEAAERRQITARNVIEIVHRSFRPEAVATALAELLASPAWDEQKLYRGLVDALRRLTGKLRDRPRTDDLISAELTQDPDFADVLGTDVAKGLSDLAAASQGALTRTGSTVVLNTSVDELEQRVASLTGRVAPARRRSTLRVDDANGS
jgi:hypothetical protein